MHFCPRCHKPVARTELVSVCEPAPDGLLILSDEETEELVAALRRKLVRVLTAPAWKAAIMLDPQSSKNISFGCPWCRKGKVTLFKE